jgi:AraC-like DNA-binding protein
MNDTAKIESATGASAGTRKRKRRMEPWREAPVWETVPGSDWRQLYGGFDDLGVSLEWQEFQSPRPFEWSRSFHPDSLELCLNLEGQGTIHGAGEKMDFGPLTAGFYLTGKRPLRASRAPNQRQRFISVEFSRSFLRDRLAACDGALHPIVEGFARGDWPASSLGGVHRLTAGQEQRLADLRNPTALQGARPLWYEAKVLELMAEFFFERQGEDELFCDRQKRLARERADRVVAVLRKRLEESLSLKEIGREVGCSPFHLSRTFSAETGMTISQYLRRLRMERAAELLRSGKYNVTEAALAVGYSSLSYFSQAFCQTMGCCPGLYPLKTAEQGTAVSAS